MVFEENFTCPQLWERFVIGADGNVMLCANDEMESYRLGNVQDESVFDIWHGEKLNKAREIHLKHMGTKEIEKSEKSIGEALRISEYIMGSMGAVFILFPEFILSLFTSDVSIVTMGIWGLRVIGLFSLLMLLGLQCF